MLVKIYTKLTQVQVMLKGFSVKVYLFEVLCIFNISFQDWGTIFTKCFIEYKSNTSGGYDRTYNLPATATNGMGRAKTLLQEGGCYYEGKNIVKH